MQKKKRANNRIAVTKRDLRAKEEQIIQLEKNLKQKIEELEEIEGSNKELKQKLMELHVRN